MTRNAICLSLVLIAACTRPTVVQERVSTASVPVTVPCLSGPRPAPVEPLQARLSDEQWKALTPKQKAALVAAQGQRHQTRAQALDAATGACQ